MASSRDGETHELMHTRRKRLHKEFVSPMLPISKRSHIEKSLAWSAMSEEGGRQNPDTLPAPRHNVPAPKRSGAAGDLLDTQSLLQERDALKKKLKMAEEQLRKLHMVKTYRHKVCVCVYVCAYVTLTRLGSSVHKLGLGTG